MIGVDNLEIGPADVDHENVLFRSHCFGSRCIGRCSFGAAFVGVAFLFVVAISAMLVPSLPGCTDISSVFHAPPGKSSLIFHPY